MKTTNQKVGRFGEKATARYLKKQGYKILSQNRTFSHLELDILACNREYLCFVEVKTSLEESKNFSSPKNRVDSEKQKNMLTLAYTIRKTLPSKYQDLIPRIDVCEILLSQEKKKWKVSFLNYIEGAVTK